MGQDAQRPRRDFILTRRVVTYYVTEERDRTEPLDQQDKEHGLNPRRTTMGTDNGEGEVMEDENDVGEARNSVREHPVERLPFRA